MTFSNEAKCSAFKIDTTVPYGNACDLSISESENMVEISFAADPHGGPECLWFCFRLTQDIPQGHASTTRTDRKIGLILKHLHNMLGGNNFLNIRPVIRYADGDWERLPAGTVEVLPDGRNRVAWFIDAGDQFVDIAVCYPYGQPEIDQLLCKTNGYWQADTIGVSQEGRPLVRLSNSYGQIDNDRPGLYLIARQHSGETPGSWVLDGFLRHIAALGKNAPLVWCTEVLDFGSSAENTRVKRIGELENSVWPRV